MITVPEDYRWHALLPLVKSLRRQRLGFDEHWLIEKNE
jgi:hypothetical protein